MNPEWIGQLIVRDLKGLERELEGYPDDATIWREIPGITNTAGTLALHLAGNLQHFVGARLGGTGYVRDRPSEFSRRGVSRAELVEGIHAARSAVEKTLTRDRSIDWNAPFPDPLGGYTIATGDFLIHLASHLAYHLGQVDYHRRVATGQTTSITQVSQASLATARKEAAV
jgi:hypothetical protein